MARAHGSYPWCHGFKSLFRYFIRLELCSSFFVIIWSAPYLIAGAGEPERKGELMRVGMGYDVHKLSENRKLILGGVEIPFEKGLLGHSDADVLLHAVMDALLGAAALGDIGKHFPDSDDAYKGISSLKLLEKVGELLDENLFVINNIDVTLIAQQPKIAPYRKQMTDNIAAALRIDSSLVNVKATTEEGLGFTGEMKGMSAQAICSVSRITELSYEAVSEGCQGCSGCRSRNE